MFYFRNYRDFGEIDKLLKMAIDLYRMDQCMKHYYIPRHRRRAMKFSCRSSSATREIPRILWQSEVYYRMFVIYSYQIRMNSVHALSLYFGNILLTLRRLMPYIYGAPILDVSRSHTTTQHSR